MSVIKSITAAIHIERAFYRESDEKNDYFVESEKVKERTTPTGEKEYYLNVTVVVKPRKTEWESLEGQGLDKPLTKWDQEGKV